jgi:CHAT domain-containing protein
VTIESARVPPNNTRNSGEPNRRIQVVVVAAAAIAIPLVLLWYSGRNAGIAPLVRAADALSHRTIAARLSGGFAHRPFAGMNHQRKAEVVGRAVTRRVAAAAASASASVHDTRRGESLHRAAVAYLLVGDAEAAVFAIEESLRHTTGERDNSRAIQRSSDTNVLLDLAASYLTRAGADDDLDFLAAMNAAERAWRLKRTPEIAWNRALAYSVASSRETAAVAWDDFLALDSGSPWSVEARQRRSAVLAGGPASRESVNRSLYAALSRSDDDALRDAVATGAGIARAVAEEELLPAWGAGDDAALAQTRRLGAAVASIGGDFVVADSIAGIDALPEDRVADVRAALVSFGKGRKALTAYRYEDALPLLEDAQKRLEDLAIPLAARARVFVATLHFYAKDAERSLAICAEAVKTSGSVRYPSVAAQCSWNEATIETGRRRFDRAKAAYESARNLFERMRDVKSAAAVDVRLEENNRWTGDVANAWVHMLRAFRNGAAERGYIPFSEGGKLADAAGMPFAALAFYELAIGAARAAGSAAEQTDGHLSRAELFWKLGREDDARAEVHAAMRFMQAIGDRTVASRLESSLVLARGRLFATTHPEEVTQQLERAIADFRARGNRRKIADARVVQAEAHLARRDSAAAERSLLAALTEIEWQREQISTDEERLALVDTAREATELLVALYCDSHRMDDALAVVERTKARLLLDASGGSSPGTSAEIIRPDRDEAFVEYFVLADRVVIWTVTSTGMQAHIVAADRLALEKRIDAMRAALAAGDRDAIRTLREELFEQLLRPVWQGIRAHRSLVFAPDGALYRLPFAALASRESSYIAEDYDIANVPSLTWLAAARRGLRFPARPDVLVAVPSASAGKEESGFSRLSAAAQEGREIALRFPGATVLSDADATAGRVAAAMADADLFHFAGHAVVDSRRPGRSALVMSGGGLLRASEIAGWPLRRTRLVVLAACSTGAGRVSTDGSVSLARAFLLAGADSAVATLWPVRDDLASEISKRFYAALASGSNARQALRAAQRSVIYNPKFRAQYDWAAFQLIGS